MTERILTPRKILGAYYTDPAVVRFLVDWGLRRSPGVVMDPSCGDGRFLTEATAPSRAEPGTGLIGCDLDAGALASADAALAARAVPYRLLKTDFFRLEPAEIEPVDLVVGNPPFIRYQRFSGDSRTRALASALRVGARLSRLAASWAPFLLHAVQFLRPGGALAMVVPAELAQTSYGLETLRALCANFGRIRLLAFRQNWFDGAQQETFLLLAEERGADCRAAELVPLDRIADLEAACAVAAMPPTLHLDIDTSLGLAFVDPATRELYLRLGESPDVHRLDALGVAANGYVSGANAFFHTTEDEAAKRGLPGDWLVPVARNSRSIVGLEFTAHDLAAAESLGRAHHLILPRRPDLFAPGDGALEAFIRAGLGMGVADRYKCRVRNPWWLVSGLVQADVLLPYMIGNEPHAAVNRCHALYPNSLHGLRLAHPPIAERVALGLLTSLSLLSMEIEGRSYGGGVLKLEPTEIGRVLVVLPPIRPEARLWESFRRADDLVRERRFDEASRLADALILDAHLGLPTGDIQRLRDAREILRRRRAGRAGNRSGRPVTADDD